LLQGDDATLKNLYLSGNKIDDEGVDILVDALQNNTSLTTLNLKRNDEISKQGQILLLKLVNDISSIKATLQSNRTLKSLSLEILDADEEIQTHIDMATYINTKNKRNPEAAGRKKMIQTQLNSGRRAEFAALQGIDHSLYSEIDPLHLPEVLSLVGQHHGQGELHVALRSSIAGVISTVNRKQCLQQQRSYYRAKIAHHKAIIAEYRTKAGRWKLKLRQSKQQMVMWWISGVSLAATKDAGSGGGGSGEGLNESMPLNHSDGDRKFPTN
jgi:hypothetical protein